ncbi:MAG: hypothetical protein OZ921_18345 [Sorangiineae bacterium]|nr:hypothetical protein [Polyangiaceae bacterium]MEB2324481.1 hypothetical protein [Sorangiineae bacterium]
MSDGVTLHVVRPYASEAELIEAEAWAFSPKGMVLIGEGALPADTVVRFDVSLSDGTKLVVAEGRVLGVVAPENDRPGGLRVRFRRFGAATKAFVERAVAARGGDQSVAVSASMPPAASAPDSARDASGIHARPLPAPADREALLARLRARRRGLDAAGPAAPGTDESAG